MEIVEITAEILLMSAIGFLVRKLVVKDDEFCKNLSKVLINVVVPAVIINSMSSIEFSPAEFRTCGVVLLLSFALFLFLMLLGYVVYAALGKGALARVVRFGMVFTNYSSFGYPIVEAVCDARAMMYFVLLTIPMRIFYYALAETTLSPEAPKGTAGVKKFAKCCLSAPVIACAAGFLLFSFRLSLPPVISVVVLKLSNCCMPLGMMVTGMIIASYDAKSLVSFKSCVMPLMRNIVTPLVVFAVLLVLPLDDIMKRILLLYCIMPNGLFTAPFCLQYDPDKNAHLISAGGTLISTALAILTVPVWILLITTNF